MNKTTIFLLVLLAVFSSCKAPRMLEYKNIDHLKLQQVGVKQTTLSMDIRLYNPNRYAVKLKQADIAVTLNGKPLGKMKVDGKQTINKLDTCSLPVLMDVDLKNVLSNALGLLLGSDMKIKLTGTVKAGRRGTYLTVPVNYECNQDILSGIKW